MICKNYWHFYTYTGHQYIASKILFYVIAKCLLVVPSCNSFINFWAFMVDKHLFNLLSCPIIYKTSCKNIMTSFNHSSYVKNKLAAMVYYGTLEASMTSSNLHKTFATTLLLHGLYTTMKSCSINNNNHPVIFLKSFGLFTK